MIDAQSNGFNNTLVNVLEAGIKGLHGLKF
jgi:hypothetical protein